MKDKTPRNIFSRSKSRDKSTGIVPATKPNAQKLSYDKINLMKERRQKMYRFNNNQSAHSKSTSITNIPLSNKGK